MSCQYESMMDAVFWPPFATACEQFVENTSSSRIKFFSLFFYRLYYAKPMRSCPAPSKEVARPRLGVSKDTMP